MDYRQMIMGLLFKEFQPDQNSSFPKHNGHGREDFIVTIDRLNIEGNTWRSLTARNPTLRLPVGKFYPQDGISFAQLKWRINYDERPINTKDEGSGLLLLVHATDIFRQEFKVVFSRGAYNPNGILAIHPL